jgi:hypothetical protein
LVRDNNLDNHLLEDFEESRQSMINKFKTKNKINDLDEFVNNLLISQREKFQKSIINDKIL